MLELAIFQTGPTDLPSVAAEGIRVNSGTLAETHESFQRGLVDQIRQGILADEMGGFSGQETEEQMRRFAADCVPQLAKACGGLKVNPEVAPDLEVGEAVAVS